MVDASSAHQVDFFGNRVRPPKLDLKKHICKRDRSEIICLKCGQVHPVLLGSRDRTCPACNTQNYARLNNRFKNVILSAQKPVFLTLTAKPVPKQDVKIVRDLGKALTRFLHRKPYNKCYQAVLAVMECKKTSYGWFYYHIHCLLDGAYVPQSQISKDWFECSGFPIVWVERVRSPARALKYVLKYILKGFSSDVEQDRLDFKESMKGARFVRSYGNYYDFYHSATHVYFPCPNCKSVKSWVVWDFCNQIDLFEGQGVFDSG